PPATELDVPPVGLRTHLREETKASLERSGALQLVAEHRREGERYRRPPQHAEEGQVGASYRLPEPFLAERPGAESEGVALLGRSWPGRPALHIGHVRVQHERQRPVAAHPPSR